MHLDVFSTDSFCIWVSVLLTVHAFVVSMIFSNTKSFKAGILQKRDEKSDVGANAVRIQFLGASYVTSMLQMHSTTETVIIGNSCQNENPPNDLY